MRGVTSSINWSRFTRTRNNNGDAMREFAGAALAAMLAALLSWPASAQTLRPDQQAFRAIYKELVETNTTLSAGDCTVAAQKVAARLKAAGYPDGDLHIFTAPGHPKEGGL